MRRSHTIMVANMIIHVTCEMQAEKIPWGEFGAEYIAECSGKYTNAEAGICVCMYVFVFFVNFLILCI